MYCLERKGLHLNLGYVRKSMCSKLRYLVRKSLQFTPILAQVVHVDKLRCGLTFGTIRPSQISLYGFSSSQAAARCSILSPRHRITRC